MAKILSKSGVTSLSVVKPGQISQSIDAFTGVHAYDIYLSGSFNMTGSITGSSTVSMLTASIGGGAFTSASLTANSGVGTLQQVTDQGSITTTPITASFISSSNDITCLRVFATNINSPEFASSTGIINIQTPTKFALGAAITASAPISSSGYLIINDITASGNISSSGTFIGDGSTLTNLQRPISNSIITNFTASNLNSGFYFRAGGSVTCSIQSSSLVACNVGSEFEFFQTSSAGYVSFLTGSGVTLNSKGAKLKLAGQFSAATLKKVGSDPDTWDLIGDLG